MMSGDSVINARLCVLRLWPDFSGYGFNLHGEKGKAGHFIGDVEANSPSESAGLRKGDRLVEVNGANVHQETHKEVVQRIKAGEGHVTMLVVDEETENQAIQAGILISCSTAEVKRIEAAESQAQYERTTQVEVEVVATAETPNEEPVEPAEPERTEEEQRQYEEREPSPEPEQPRERTPTSEPEPTPVVQDTQPNGEVSMKVVATPVEQSSAASNGESRLSAAEFRARLQAQKKKDPRRSGATSFKDKTAMFEKM